MKAFIYFIITLILPTLIFYVVNETQIIIILAPIFLLLFSYFMASKENETTVKLYIYFTFVLKILFDIIILIVDNNLIIFDITTLFLAIPVLGTILFGNIIILIGVLFGFKKQEKILQISFLKRAFFYVLVIIFALLNLYLNDYCGLTGLYCHNNYTAFIHVLFLIPILELIFTIYYHEPYKLIKIIILSIIIFLMGILEIYIINKANYKRTCFCAYAYNCTLKSENIYECEFIGTDGKTFCQLECPIN